MSTEKTRVVVEGHGGRKSGELVRFNLTDRLRRGLCRGRDTTRLCRAHLVEHDAASDVFFLLVVPRRHPGNNGRTNSPCAARRLVLLTASRDPMKDRLESEHYDSMRSSLLPPSTIPAERQQGASTFG